MHCVWTADVRRARWAGARDQEKGLSRENVELVRSLHPPPGADLAQNIRDDLRWAQVSAVLAPALAHDFKCLARGYLEADGEAFEGLAGLRYLWLEWLTPWTSYRTEVEEMVDLGDQVLVLVRDFGRHADRASEVAITSAAVWTVRDGKVTQIVFCAERSTALKAVGLEE
jgi:ketosteroid isomerase-like protein